MCQSGWGQGGLQCVRVGGGREVSSVSEWGQGGLTEKVTFQQSPGGKGTRSVLRRGYKGRGRGTQPEGVTAGVGGCQQGPAGLGRVWLQLGRLNSVHGLWLGHHHCLGGLWTDAAAFLLLSSPLPCFGQGASALAPGLSQHFPWRLLPESLPCLAPTLVPPSLG